MKKTLVAILVLALASLAALSAVDSFDVDTEVEGVSKMKITTCRYSSTIPEDLEGADSFGSLDVVAAGSQNFSAWLSTMSNNRTGYTVSMSATAMKNTNPNQAEAYINYTVSVDNKAITTNNTTSSPTSIDVITVTDLTELTVASSQIALTVDPTTFSAAIEGSYAGTVTFTFAAT